MQVYNACNQSLQPISDGSCTHGDVRLVGGVDPSQGNVQVCAYGVWGYVCHYGWNIYEVQVVCRQLGYSTKGQYTTCSNYNCLLLHLLFIQEQHISTTHIMDMAMALCG